MKKCLFPFLLAFFIMGIAQASAHEFLLKPVQFEVSPGMTLPFSVVSCHVFMISEEQEPLKDVEVTLHGKNTATPVDLSPNKDFMTLDGRVPTNEEGTVILAGHRKGIVWTKTTKGWQQAPKNMCKGVLHSGKYEKFCKTLITIGKDDDGWKKQLGHKLEIVPLDDPTTAKPGDTLRFQVLFNGTPFPTEAWATYDGFTLVPNTYAYYTEGGDNGIIRVKIDHTGTWMVRVKNKISEQTPTHDIHEYRAVLVFHVN